jgi:ketol-acid reductoisomerase
MNLDFTTKDELNELIRQININYYERFNANILYLEELADKIFIIYIIELRDAYSHLVRVFDYDVNNQVGKQNVQQHLEKYVNHLQRGLLDTFRKILAMEYSSARKSVHKNNVQAFDQYIAERASKLRVMNEENSVDNRISGYIELMEYLSKTRKQLETK